MKLKTSELSGIALDWAVAYADGLIGLIYIAHPTEEEEDEKDPILFLRENRQWVEYCPSSNWSQGGPIIERKEMSVWIDNGTDEISEGWDAEVSGSWFTGPTLLIAAMRCYVASKLGEEVDIPDELLEE